MHGGRPGRARCGSAGARRGEALCSYLLGDVRERVLVRDGERVLKRAAGRRGGGRRVPRTVTLLAGGKRGRLATRELPLVTLGVGDQPASRVDRVREPTTLSVGDLIDGHAEQADLRGGCGRPSFRAAERRTGRSRRARQIDLVFAACSVARPRYALPVSGVERAASLRDGRSCPQPDGVGQEGDRRGDDQQTDRRERAAPNGAGGGQIQSVTACLASRCLT